MSNVNAKCYTSGHGEYESKNDYDYVYAVLFPLFEFESSFLFVGNDYEEGSGNGSGNKRGRIRDNILAAKSY